MAAVEDLLPHCAPCAPPLRLKLKCLVVVALSQCYVSNHIDLMEYAGRGHSTRTRWDNEVMARIKWEIHLWILAGAASLGSPRSELVTSGVFLLTPLLTAIPALGSVCRCGMWTWVSLYKLLTMVLLFFCTQKKTFLDVNNTDNKPFICKRITNFLGRQQY